MSVKKVIISGGGTGGHIFPALSIANALRRRDPDIKILFVGAKGRMEMERVPAAGYDIEGLEVMGFDRRRLWRNVKVLWKLMKSRRKAKKIIRDFGADVVVGVGGYASGPTLMMAQKLGIPTLIQEQNSYAGVTNKHLGKKAGCICVAYDNMERFFPAGRIVMTGNPVREAITACHTDRAEAKRQLGFDPGRPLVAVVGGSLGARTINEAVKASMDRITATGAQILWQTGKYYAGDCLPAAEVKRGCRRWHLSAAWTWCIAPPTSLCREPGQAPYPSCRLSRARHTHPLAQCGRGPSAQKRARSCRPRRGRDDTRRRRHSLARRHRRQTACRP